MPSKPKVFELLSEDITGAGGPMGSQMSFENFHKLFSPLTGAKKFAEKDYGRKITWTKQGGKVSSGDLMSVMYTIREVEVK